MVFQQLFVPAFSRYCRISSVIACCIASACISTACGFHPRGNFIQTTELRSVFVDADRDLSIAEEVREALLDNSFTLSGNRDEAMILLRLNDESEGQRVLSVTSNGRVSELELRHSVNMLIAESSDGVTAPVYSPEQSFNRVEVTREYTYDETGVLGKENEARILREEMKRDLVRQIILRSIASLTPSVAG